MPLPTICLLRPTRQGEIRRAGFAWRSGSAIKHLGPILAKEGIHLTADFVPDACAYRYQHVDSEKYKDLENLRQWGAKIVADFDDHPFVWPPLPNVPKEFQHIVKAGCGNAMQAEVMQKWIDFSDICTVTTDYLGGTLGRDYVLLPNLIDMDDYVPRAVPERDHVLVLFCGSQSHIYDLVQMTDPIESLLNAYPQVRFLFWGCYMSPAMELRSRAYGERWMHRPWSDFGGYHQTLMEIAPDIGICPLDSNPFALARSPIKWFEYTLAGAAVVASDVGLYQPFCKYRCRTAQDWYDTLAEMIQHRYLRQTEHARSLPLVAENHAWQSETARRPWLEFFRGLMNG